MRLPCRPGQERLLIKHRITKKNIWFSGGQLNHIQKDDNTLKVKGWLALDKGITFQVLRQSWERLNEKRLFEEYIDLSEIASPTFKQHLTYPYRIRQGKTLPLDFLNQFGHKDWHSNHDRSEASNWVKTFRYIDWMLQGKEDATTLIVHYPNHQQSSNDEPEFDEATLDLTFALTELLPGNVSYRLRDERWIHWTPIPQEGESTFLYPEEDELDESGAIIGRRIIPEYEPEEDDLANKPNSIFGVPRYLNNRFPHLKFISLKRLRVEQFSKPSDLASANWYFNTDDERAIRVEARQTPPPNSVPIARRTATRANSIVIPYIASARSVERRNLDAPLNTLFSTIEGYITDGRAMLGYTRVFYEMQIDLKTGGKKDYKKLLKDKGKETLLRHFYPPYPKKDAEGKAEPVLVGYSLETHGIAFNVNSDLLDKLVQNILEDESLRLSIRRKMALYYFSSYATENSLFMAEVLRISEVVIDYWLHNVVPNSSSKPQLLDRGKDIEDIKDYYKKNRNVQPSEIKIFSQVVTSDFLERINEVLERSFKNTQEISDFIKSTILYSLSALIKTLVARLGGVSYPVNPALIIKELLTLHNQLNAQVPGSYPREAVVCQAVQTLDAKARPYISQLRDALQANGVAQNELNRDLAVQLIALYSNSCEDGCPVCMSEGSDVEHYHLAPLLRSRQVLNKLREELFTPLPQGDCLADVADRLKEGETVEVKRNMSLLDNRINHQLGLATVQKTNQAGQLEGSIAIPLNEGKDISEVLTTEDAWEKRWGSDQFKPYVLSDGRRVRSKEEYIIARELIDEQIHFDLETPIPYRSTTGETRRIHPDFYLYDYNVYLEYWGRNDSEYMESRRFKEAIYEQRKIKFIAIEDEDLRDQTFLKKIKSTIENLGLD